MRNLTSTIELSNGSFLMDEDNNSIELDGLLQYIYSTKKVLDYNGLIHLSKYIEENYVDMTTLGAVVDAMQVALDNIAIPTKTSDLVNDSIVIPTKTSDLVNDSIVVPTKISDLVNDSIIVPTKTSDLINDSGFVPNITIIDVSVAHSANRTTNYTGYEYIETAPPGRLNSHSSTNLQGNVGHTFDKAHIYYPGQPYTYAIYDSYSGYRPTIYMPGYIYTLQPLPDNISTYSQYQSYLVFWTTKTQILNKGGNYSEKNSTGSLNYIYSNNSIKSSLQRDTQYYCYFVDLNTSDYTIIRPGQTDSRGVRFNYDPKLSILPSNASSNQYIEQRFYAWGPYYSTYYTEYSRWKSYGYDTIKKNNLYPAILIEADRTTLIINANTEYIISNIQQISAGSTGSTHSDLKDNYDYNLNVKNLDARYIALNHPIYIGRGPLAPGWGSSSADPFARSVGTSHGANLIGYANLVTLSNYSTEPLSNTVSGYGLIFKEGTAFGQYIIGRYNYINTKGYLDSSLYSPTTIAAADNLGKIEEWQPYKNYESGTIVKTLDANNNTIYYQAHTGSSTSTMGFNQFTAFMVPKYTYPILVPYYWSVIYNASSELGDYYKSYSYTNANGQSATVDLTAIEEWSSEKTYYKNDIVKIPTPYYNSWDYITDDYQSTYSQYYYVYLMCIQDECPPYVPLTCQQFWHTMSGTSTISGSHTHKIHDHLFTIGNGTDMYYNRSNAFAVDASGDAFLNKDLYIHCDASSKNGVKVATITELSTISDEVSTINSSITELDTTIYQLRRRIATLESEVASLKNSSNNATDSQLESETGSIITDENGNPIEFDLPASITPSTVVMEDGQPLYTESGNTLEYNQQGG